MAISLLAFSLLLSSGPTLEDVLPPPQPLPELRVGSPAPPISVDRWLKGDAVTKLEKGKVYVLDFWATWCGPCISSMPHLAKLQAKYSDRGVVVIGVTSPDEYGNNLEAVSKFVQKNSDVMAFRVAWDTRTVLGYENVFKGKTSWAYLGATKAMTIPTTFVIDRDGKVAYIGDPAFVDGPLGKIVEGKFDLAKAAEVYRTSKPYERTINTFGKLMGERAYDKAYALAWALVEGPLKEHVWAQWMIAEVITSLSAKHERRDLKLALKCAEAAVALSGGTHSGSLRALAATYHHLGRNEEARALIDKAIALSTGVEKEGLEKVRERMKSG